jgi:pilus assembly protein CpaC
MSSWPTTRSPTSRSSRTRQLYVFGKAGGETTVYASNAAGDVIWSANVRVGSNIDSVDQMLRLAMPDAKIAVSTMGTNTFLLTGTVAAPEDAAEAQRLVQAFVGKEANVISRLKMATPLQVNLQVASPKSAAPWCAKSAST